MLLGQAMAGAVGDGAHVLGCAFWEVIQSQHEWESWFQKPRVSQKHQGREECLGMLYCMFGFCQSWAQGWQDCMWMQIGVWAERLWAAVPTEEQTLKTAFPSPAAQKWDEGVPATQRYSQVRLPVPHRLPPLAGLSGPWSHWHKPGWQWAAGHNTS